jgi:phosphatidylserine decarboxylase
MRFPVAKEALKFAVPLAVLSFVLAFIHVALFALSFIAMILVLLFFRDPRRSAKCDSNCVVSPADGKIIQLKQIQDGKES